MRKPRDSGIDTGIAEVLGQLKNKVKNPSSERLTAEKSH